MMVPRGWIGGAYAFFFQAEDGIRDLTVTGVQTCALPIYFFGAVRIHDPEHRVDHGPIEDGCDCAVCARHSRAYLHHLFKVGDVSAERLAKIGRASCRERV